MAIDRTGISSLQTGAPDIKYTGDQGPRSPDQQLMASADPMLVEMYQQYVFEMEEQGMQPMSFRQFMQQAMSGMAYGGTARPTYTQSRKQRINAAGGGSMGSNAGSMLVAPTADGSRPRYGWLDDIGDFLGSAKDKIVDDIIPNEIKENPVLTAATLAATTKLPIPGVEGWLGKGLEAVKEVPVLGNIANVMQTTGTGITDLINRIPGVNLPGGTAGDGRSQALQKIAGIIDDPVGTATKYITQKDQNQNTAQKI